MDLSCASKHRLCQSCCHCHVAHHISHSQMEREGGRRKGKVRPTGRLLEWPDVCVHPAVSAVAGAHCTLHPLQRHHVHGCGDTFCQEHHPNPSSPLPPGMTFVICIARLYTTLMSIQAVRAACVSASLLQTVVTGTPEQAPFCTGAIFHANPPWKHLKGLKYVYFTSIPLRQWE